MTLLYLFFILIKMCSSNRTKSAHTSLW